MAFELFRMAGNIILNTSEAMSGLSNIENRATRTGQVLSKVGEKMKSAGTALTMGVTLPIVAALGKSIQLASDLAESANVVNVTFGKSAKEVTTWSKTLNEKFGIVQLEAMKYVGAMGAMLKSSGLSAKSSKEMAQGLVELTGDMSSFYNLSHEETWEKIRAGIGGETEPLKALGINMSVANMEAYALSKGIKKAWKEMNQAEQTQLRYNYLMKVTADAQGDFARTSEGFANKLRMVQGRLTELGTQIGTILLPYVEKITIFVDNWAKKFTLLNTHAQKVVIVIGLFAAAIGPILLFGGTLVGTIASLVTVIGVLTPQIIAVIAVAAAITGVFAALSIAIGTVVIKTGILQKAFNFIKISIEALKNVMNLDYAAAMKTLKENLGMTEKEAAKFVNKLIVLRDKIEGLIGVFNNFKSILDIVKNIISNDYQANMDILTKKFGLTEKEAAKLVNKFIEWKRRITDLYTEIKDKLITSLEWLFNKFLEMKTIDTSFIVNLIRDIISLTNKIKSFTNIFAETIKKMDFSTLAKSWEMLKSQGAPLLLLFKGLGIVLGTVLAIGLGVVLGAVNGLVAAFPYLLAIIANVVNLSVALLTGWIKLVKGIFTGDFNLIKAYFADIWKAIGGIFENAAMAIGSLIGGFCSGIIKFFKNLYNVLVGHSIVPDLINAIVRYFKSLPGKVFSILTSLVSGAINKFNSLKKSVMSVVSSFVSSVISKISSFVSNFISKLVGLPKKAATQFNNLKTKASSIVGGIAKSAYTWGSNLVSSFTKGIVSKAGGLKEALHNTANKIKDFLGFSSPTKEGPGSNSDKWAPSFMNMFIAGLKKSLPALTSTVKAVAETIRTNFYSATTAVTGYFDKMRNSIRDSISQQKSEAASKIDEMAGIIEESLNRRNKAAKVEMTPEQLLSEQKRLLDPKNAKELESLLKQYYPDWQNQGQSIGDQIVNGLNSSKTSMSSAIKTFFGEMGESIKVNTSKAIEYVNSLEKTYTKAVAQMQKNSTELEKLKEKLEKANDIDILTKGKSKSNIAKQKADKAALIEKYKKEIATMVKNNSALAKKYNMSYKDGHFFFPDGTQAFAGGVKNFRGGWALVGEKGPELLKLPRGSDVIPNDKLTTASNRSIILNINNPQIFDRRGVRQVADQIKTELQPYLNFKRG